VDGQNGQASLQLAPTEVTLEDNFPNPFNPVTTIRFGLPKTQHVTIAVYSVTGAKVIGVLDADLAEGYHQVSWNGVDQSNNPVASGIYIYELRTKNRRLIKKMLLTK